MNGFDHADDKRINFSWHKKLLKYSSNAGAMVLNIDNDKLSI